MTFPPGFEAEGRWDAELADALIGATVIVGLTWLDAAGEVDRLEQFWGVVETADAETGIALRLCGTRAGERYTLPPDTSAFEPADPGTYRLRSTGEEVEDPDYLSPWTIKRQLV